MPLAPSSLVGRRGRAVVADEPEPLGRRVPMSLSPRPERLTSRTASGPSSAADLHARRRGRARDSMAGMMPSVRRQQRERLHRLGVGDRAVLARPDVAQVGVLGADAGVVEAGRDRVRLDGLAVLVLQDVGAARRAARPARRREMRGGVLAGLDALAAGLEADRARTAASSMNAVEDADRVGAAADAGERRRRAGGRRARGTAARASTPMTAVEVADHLGERVRAGDRAEEVVGVVDVGDPVAQRLVDRVLERRAAGVDGHDLGAEQPHPGDVERLALGVDLRPCRRRTRGRAARPRWRVATPCWPAPVSAMTRVLPIRLVSSAWPSTLLILCEPVWLRSSRLRRIRAPTAVLGEPRRSVERCWAGRRSRAGSRRSSPTNAGSAMRLAARPRRARSRAAISASGTNRPPNPPKRPCAEAAALVGVVTRRRCRRGSSGHSCHGRGRRPRGRRPVTSASPTSTAPAPART